MVRRLVLLLTLAGVALVVTAIPGVFTVDEDHALVVANATLHGRLSVPGTEDLPPSRELLYFDPGGHHRRVDRTPVYPSALPLYGFIALPFALLGWYGLTALNVLAFLTSVLLVFLLARRCSTSRWTPWIAATALGLGGFSIEYAQGVWPHWLSACLSTLSFYLSARVRGGANRWLALAAGVSVGLAAGVRYQNIVFAGCIGLTLLSLAPRRWLVTLLFVVGLAGPLVASAAINAVRLGTFNPITKGSHYLTMPPPNSGKGGSGLGGRTFEGPLRAFWARTVDMSAHPALQGAWAKWHPYAYKDPETGAFLAMGTLKKAWAQSSPWLLLVLVGLLVAWSRVRQARSDPKLRELLSAALVVFPTLGTFAVAGLERFDGLCFNQRYFIELVPLAALAFALLVDKISSPPMVWVGASVGTGLAAACLTLIDDPQMRALVLVKLPLVLGGALVLLWAIPRWRGRAMALLVGGCLAWGLSVHLLDDMPAARRLRRDHYRRMVAMAPHLTGRTALFAVWGMKDPYGPLQLDHDLVILDLLYDDGKAAPQLVPALLREGRKVVVLTTNVTPSLLQQMAGCRQVTTRLVPVLGQPPLRLAEIVANRSDRASALRGR